MKTFTSTSHSKGTGVKFYPVKLPKLDSLIENLVNGNNTTAKNQAKRYPAWQIRKAMLEMGWSLNKATLAADWLKGRDCWQAYCDAN